MFGNLVRDYGVVVLSEFLSATQSLVQVDEALDFFKLVGGLRQLGRQQALTGGQYFQIGGVSVFHQQRGAGVSPFQCGYLLPVVFLFRLLVW